VTGSLKIGSGRRAWFAGSAISALVAATFAQSASMVSDQGIPVLLPFIKHDLNLSLPAAALLVTIMGAGRLIASLPVGQLVDRIGSRAVLGGTCIVLALILVLASLAHSLPVLAVLLIAAGAATAGTTSAGAALVAQAFGSRRGLAMGIRQSGVPLGGLIGALLLPWIAETSSWHWAIAVSAAIAGAGAVVVYALTTKTDEVKPDRPAMSLILSMVRSRPLLALFLWGGVFVVGQYSFITLIAVQEGGLGLGVLMVTFAQLGGALGRPAWGLFSDLIGRRRRACMLLISGAAVASCLVVGRVQPSAGPWLLGVFAFAFGVALIGWQGLWATSIAEIAGPGQAGTALGFGQMFIQVGIIGGPAALALIAETGGGFTLAWTVLAGALLLASTPLVLIRTWPVEGQFAVKPAP
jgi:MFS family permease